MSKVDSIRPCEEFIKSSWKAVLPFFPRRGGNHSPDARKTGNQNHAGFIVLVHHHMRTYLYYWYEELRTKPTSQRLTGLVVIVLLNSLHLPFFSHSLHQHEGQTGKDVLYSILRFWSA